MYRQRRFRLRSATLAIDSQRHMAYLPEGTNVEVIGRETETEGLIRIFANRRMFEVFERDLYERGTELSDSPE